MASPKIADLCAFLDSIATASLAGGVTQECVFASIYKEMGREQVYKKVKEICFASGYIKEDAGILRITGKGMSLLKKVRAKVQVLQAEKN